MSQLTQLRLAGYTAIISMHITNIYYMDWYRKQIHTDDERILAFRHLGNRFLTTWTFMLQIAYAFFGIICDVLIMKNNRKQSYTLPMHIGEIRDAIFSAVIWPSSWVVSIIFWGLFNYDRSLIFPEHLDVVLPTVSNHIIHTAIVAIVFFEVLSRPRTEPSSHFKNIGLMTLYISLYLMVMLFTYKERNVWLYPIFGQLYGSISFLFLLAAVYALLIVFYCLQWPLSNIIYPHGATKKRKIQKRKKRD